MVQKVKQIIILHRDLSKLMFFIVPGLKWMQLPPRQLRHKVLLILEVLGDPIVYLVAPHIFVHLDLDSQVLPDRPDLCLCEKSTRMDFSKGCLTMRKRARHWANSWKQTGKKKNIWSSSSDVAVSWKKGTFRPFSQTFFVLLPWNTTYFIGQLNSFFDKVSTLGKEARALATTAKLQNAI